MTDATMTAVFGMRGQGKSTLVKSLLRERRRVIVFDPMEEYDRAGCRRVTWQQLSATLVRRDGSARGFKLSYVPMHGYEPDALHQLAKGLMAYQRISGGARLTLVVEEMSTSFPDKALPRDMFGFRSLCERGRHYNIEVIGTTQRPASVSTHFRGNCDEVYIFRLGIAADLDAVGRMIGREHRDDPRELRVHEYLHFREGQLARGRNRLRAA